jgi:predicted ABC-type transport system involved in lysophospholipase L1 biosynthesis ATPase subunit
VLDVLERLNGGGLTLVVVTHDPAVARRAGRVLVMQDGRIVQRVAAAAVHEAVELAGAAAVA